MIIESVKLNHFRNYDQLELSLDKGTNLFYGDNAQGKTNILESVYVCGTTRSHKGSKDREMIRFGDEEAHICMKILKRGIPYRIDMHLKKNKSKGIAINGVDMELCQLDKVYLHHLASYNKILAQRNKLLKDLVFYPESQEMLDVLDEQMVQYGCVIIELREKFSREIRDIVEKILIFQGEKKNSLSPTKKIVRKRNSEIK